MWRELTIVTPGPKRRETGKTANEPSAAIGQTKGVLNDARLYVNPRLCHGCQSCMVACSLVHEGQVIPSLSRIRVVLDPFGAQHQIQYCRQCQKAACAESCPHGAIRRSTVGAYWVVDEALCDGCGACVEACPFQAMVLDPTRHLALKCDTCEGEPACVESCPKGALTWTAGSKGNRRDA